MRGRSGRLLIWLLQKNGLLFLGALACTAAAVLLGYLPPVLVAELLDHRLGGAPSRLPSWAGQLFQNAGGGAWVFGAAIVFISVLSGISSYYKGFWSARAAERAATLLRQRLYAHIQDLPYGYHASAETGDLIQRCSSDVDTVRRFLSVQLTAILNALLMLGAALAFMVPLSARITALSLSLVPLLFMFAWLFFGMVTRAYYIADESEGRLSAVLQENLSGMRVVRAFAQTQSEIRKFGEANEDFMKKALRVSWLEGAYWSVGDLLSLTQALVTLTVCVREAAAGRLSLGELVLFTSYVGMLLWPIRQLGRILSDSGKSMVALGRIAEILALPPEPREEGLLRPPLDGDIEYDRVSFSYAQGSPVLEDISFRVRRGQTVAVLGATAAGKSTLVHLLLRLYEPTAGEIRIGGVPLSSIDRSYLRRRIGLVLQETFLFSRSIRENVTVAARGAPESRLLEAASDADALGFIQESPLGFDTPVGERGVTLSGGQRQRLAIARTLLRDCDILVFDDSLSAVDTLTDAKIREALNRRRGRATTLIISHRILTLREADLILVMDRGRIVDSGTHGELLGRKGLYSRIHAIQGGLEDANETAADPGADSSYKGGEA